jgi:hypothetical protein
MNKFTLSDIEVVRIMHCAGNLRVRGGASETIVECNAEPQIRKLEKLAEILIAGNAEIVIAGGVALEILECVGNLDIEDCTAPISLGRIRGNLRTRRNGAIAIRGEVDGNLTLEKTHAIEGEQVSGNLRVDTARSVKFNRVFGNAECTGIEGDVAFEEVRGRLRVTTAGAVKAHRVAGKLEVEGVASLDAAAVGSKVKAVEVAGNVNLGKVGGRLSCDDVGGSISAEMIGGHVGLRAIRGAVALPEIGGAVDLLGPLPGEGAWKIISRGRISVEVSPETSAKFSATARYGRVRLYGVPEERFTRSGRDHVEGTLGAGGLDISLEATDADVILFGDDAHSRAYDGRRSSRDFRFGRRFSAPFENFAEDLREEIPEFVSEIVGAAGRIVSESGKFTGGIAHDVTRGVGEALREVERAIADLDQKVPHDVGDKLSKLGRRISEVVERAVEEARERRRGRANDQSRERDEGGASGSASESSAEAGSEGTRDETLMKILKAVREGSLKPEEADRLIAAWAELRRASGDKHAE